MIKENPHQIIETLRQKDLLLYVGGSTSKFSGANYIVNFILYEKCITDARHNDFRKIYKARFKLCQNFLFNKKS